MKPTSCKELKLLEAIEQQDWQVVVEMKPTSCKELKLLLGFLALHTRQY